MSSIPFFCRSTLVGAMGLALSSWAHAQAVQAPGAAAAPASTSEVAKPPAKSATVLAPVIVTGNPLGSSDIAAPVSELSGDALVLKRGTSLGDTLNGMPGVSSTYFGPNANRPIIRGLDGDRVKVLSNAGASLDASSLSFDHAVPIDPLIVDRIEVLRGPGALMYGGSAVGGVVNTLDNRIPRDALTGVSGAAEARFGGAESERGGAALVEAGNGRFALHADVFGRLTSDLHVPEYTPVEDGSPLQATKRVRNSASHTHGGALGGSVFFDGGYLGLSADTYDSHYGAVAEPDVTIQMKRDHVGLAGEIKNSSGVIRMLRAQINHTKYDHEEIEGTGEIGTTFKTSGDEVRVEAEHAPIGNLRGVVGLQLEDFDFSALGEEAFVPTTKTKRQSLFVLEELPWVAGTLTAGLRLEHVRVSSDGDVADAEEPKFGAARKRSFTLHSASLSNVYKLDPAWAVTGAFSLTERAPTSFELYANGLHAATGVFERGDTTLETERGTNLDVALQWKAGGDHLRLGAFTTSFSRFISLEASGADATVDGEDFPEYLFRSVRARLNGIEIEGKRRLLDSSVSVDLSGKLDLTRGTNRDTGEALPRVAPLRINLGLDTGYGAWGGRIEVDHAARQGRVPATDAPTAGFTIANLSLTRSFKLNDSAALWFLKLTNVGDKLAYSASTVQTVRDLAPLPGRGIKTGVRVSF